MIAIITVVEDAVTVVFPDLKKTVEFDAKKYGEMALTDILEVTEKWAKKENVSGKNGRN